MLTKTQAKIMQLFVSKIAKDFSIRRVERLLRMPYALVHRAITPLIKKHHYLIINDQNLVQLNYRDHHDVFAFVEYIRRNELLKKASHRPVKELAMEILQKFGHEYFIVILFGSAVEKANPRDFDVLFIFESNEEANKKKRAIEVIASNHSAKFDIVAVGTESIFEMAAKRDQINVFNEILNKHIVLYGAENFYRLLKDARQ